MADDFFRALRANDIKLLGGNSVVADSVARGQFDLGLTDNDDVENALREGGKLKAILPNQAIGDETGTLLIPSTAAVVTGARHSEAARQLVDYLLSAEVEKKMIEAKFALQSVRGGSGVDSPASIHPMPVNYIDAARAMPRAIARARKILEDR
jgi:ABC-type Fe3+ transport system substrate-binding protein